MTIIEHISGRVESYDHSSGAWITLCTLSDENVVSASCKRQCCPDGAFSIGGVYAATMQMVCRIPGATTYAVRGARITLASQYGSESAPQQLGVFWVTDARRTGDIFTLSAQDAMGWTDTSSYNDVGQQLAGGVGKYLAALGIGQTLEAWMKTVVGVANDMIRYQTGIPGLLSWEDYDLSANGRERYCNQMLWEQDAQGTWTETEAAAYYWIYMDTGTGDSDCPRDFLRYLAEIAGGYIYAKPETGSLTLGQFGEPRLGTAVLGMQDIERDSCEIADYTLSMMRMTVRSEIGSTVSSWAQTFLTDPTYDGVSYYRSAVEANPFVDGYANAYVFPDGVTGSLMTITKGIWHALHSYGGGFTIRPFRCKVHKQARFYPGQKISISYRNDNETAVRSYQSIVTSVTWTFRGGYILSCGGEDSRVMIDCVRMSKADKALKELRNRYAKLR